MQQENARNTILFVLCAAAILILYNMFVLEPATQQRRAEAARAKAAAASPAGQARPGAPVYLPRGQVVARTARIPLDAPSLRGSVSLRGGRIDDIHLNNYRETLARNSPTVELLRPEGVRGAFFADFGWAGRNLPGLPAADTPWRLVSGSRLTPQTPVVLAYDSPAGLQFRRRLSVDDRYMFTVVDTVANRGAAPVSIAPFASVQRHGKPASGGMNAHEGAVGVFDRKLKLHGYKGWRDRGVFRYGSTGGWLGITDKYWLAGIVPDQRSPMTGEFEVTRRPGVDIYQANYVGPERTLAPGSQTASTTHFFAGAKRAEVLRDYERSLGMPRFDDAIDWGRLYFLTRPIFWVLEQFFKLVGNFGIAILLLTVVVRILFFPLANKSYESLTKMKKLQPKMEEIRAKFKDDPQKQQQELIGLYGKEKINPLMGCLPILVQIPVFLALYKVLSVTIEMRHAPFFGWIRDLSARDPTTIWNLFGLIPWNPAAMPLVGGWLDGFLHLGVLALAYGVTLWLTQAMNPPATDPMQQRIFALMPFIFTFVMAPFAAGLLIYWTWSNVLSIGQQYVIMRRFKVDNPIDQIISRLTGKPTPAQS